MGGTELAGQALLGGEGVDGDDPAGPGQSQALDHVEADPADAEDGRGLPGLHLGPVEHGTHAGEHPAADQAGRGHRHVLRDLDGLDLLDDGRLGEHRGGGEVRCRLALVGERRRHVAERLDAPGRVPGGTGPAGPAAGQGGDHHVVAGLDRAHLAAHGLDHAGALVAEHRRRLPRDRPVDDRQVAVADPGGPDGHPDLGRPGIPDAQLVGDLHVGTGVDDASHVHAPSVLLVRCLLLPFVVWPIGWTRAVGSGRRTNRARSSRLSTLPLALVGSTSTTSTRRGTLKLASALLGAGRQLASADAAGRRSGGRDDEGEAHLAHPVVGHADHGHLGHARVAPQDGLDLGRVDVEAADDVHVLQPVGDGQVARPRPSGRCRRCAASRRASMAAAVASGSRSSRTSRCSRGRRSPPARPPAPRRRRRRRCAPRCRGWPGPMSPAMTSAESPRRHMVTVPVASVSP